MVLWKFNQFGLVGIYWFKLHMLQYYRKSYHKASNFCSAYHKINLISVVVVIDWEFEFYAILKIAEIHEF